MIQWKQRLYAFLLRRLLGPFLDASATQKLHDSLDVSLQEGRFTLTDIFLNAGYLTNLISSNSPGLSIRRARIERLEIHLTLRENIPNVNSDADDATPQSSLAWRAIKWGTFNEAMPAVSLIASIEITGVYLELEPDTVKRTLNCKPASRAEETKLDETSSKSTIGSYLDAALASLQLNLKMNDLRVKVSSEHAPTISETWIQIRLTSAAYRDLESPTTASGPINSATDNKTVLNKTLEFTGLTIQAGESLMEESKDDEASQMDATEHRVSTVALSQGTGHVYIRVFNTPQNAEGKRRAQQEIEVKLNPQFNMSVDEASIQQIQNVLRCFPQFTETEEEEVPISAETAAALNHFSSNDSDDHADLTALSVIMKQYKEAYHLTERNELRGGILIPSNAYEEGETLEDDEAVTFDAFFDANDQSFYNYASVMRESILVSDEPDDFSEFVHTKLRLHLMTGGFKVVFSDSKRNPPIRRPEEYVLLTFDDLNVSSLLTARSSDHSLSISHLEIEDAQLDTTIANGEFISIGGSPLCEGRVEIGNILRFIPVSSLVGGLLVFAMEVELTSSIFFLDNATTGLG
jgi:hypothetical protein